MKLNQQMKTLLPLAAFAGLVASAQAATIMNAGGDLNVESFDPDPTDGWRNATTAKPGDGDGDNILGTDGYSLTTSTDLPSYVLSAVVSGSHNTSNGGVIDNPLDPTGADVSAPWAGRSDSGGTFATIVFQGSTMATETLRLGVLYDSTWDLTLGTQTVTLIQTVGGGATATTPTLTTDGVGLDVAYFDVTGIQDGDTFQVRVTKGTASPVVAWTMIGGVTFDTVAVPEPSTTALLGLGGLALILRRRK